MNDHELAKSLAVAAGELLVGLRSHALNFTDDIDDSTITALSKEVLGVEADRAAHIFLSDQLAVHRPLDAVLSEEGDDSSFRHGATRVWIIDPLDGTKHYANGTDEFAVHIALWESSSERPGQLIAGAVSLPAINKVLSTGDHVGAAILGEKLETDRPVRVLISRSRPPKEIDAIVAALNERFPERGVELVPQGSAGFKVATIISGEADIYINTSGFYEWDIAAPMAIGVHNGLVACDRYGLELKFNKQDTFTPSALVARREFVSVLVDCLA